MTSPNVSVIETLRAWPAGAEALRPAPSSWAAERTLAGFPTASAAALALRGGPLAERTLESLAARREQVADLAALAGLAPRLAVIRGRWRTARVPQADLRDLEAQLVAETLALLRSEHVVSPDAVVRRAWRRVSTARRTELRRAGRAVPLDETAPAPDVCAGADGALHQILALLGSGLREGSVARRDAQALWLGACGWAGPEGAQLAGCGAGALRARRHRAVTALAGHPMVGWAGEVA